MTLDEKNLLIKFGLNPGLNFTMFRGTAGPVRLVNFSSNFNAS